MCHPETLPKKYEIGGTGKGIWNCKYARGGKATICEVKCTKGFEGYKHGDSNKKKKSTQIRCQTFKNKGHKAGSWRINKLDGKPVCNV